MQLNKRFGQRLVTLVGTKLPRAVAPIYPQVLWRGPSATKTAYLTFDDGPNPGLTERILDVLDAHQARATFFVLGRNVHKHRGLVRRIVEAGHSVGNHSFSHPDPWRASTSLVLREFERTTGILEDLTGERVRFLRPPYGHFTRAMMDWCLLRRHHLTMWDVGPGDYLELMSRDDVVREVLAHVRPGSIIALHDNTRCAVDAPLVLDDLLVELSSRGWKFPSLSEAR